MHRRLIAAIGVVVATVLLASSPASAEGWRPPPNNVVQVENYEDLSTKTKSRIAVNEEGDGDVSNENVAIAYASCTDCRTIAAAIQVIVVEAPTPTFQPGNAAVAVNESCLRCMTFAYARQVVLTPYRDIEISRSAYWEMGKIWWQVEREIRSADDFPTMSARLDALTEQLVSVVQGEIDRVPDDQHHGDDHHSDHRDVDEDA